MEQTIKNEGLINLIKKINEDKSLMDKFSQLDNINIDSMYNTALSISSGYTKEEFAEFIIYLQNINQERNLNNSQNKLDENELEKVSGGSKFGKFLDDTCEFLDCGGANIIKLLTTL